MRLFCVESHPTDDRLYVLKCSLGKSQRQVVSGLKAHYDVAALTDRLVVLCCNLKEANFKGVRSEGMVLTAVAEGAPARLIRVPIGSTLGCVLQVCVLCGLCLTLA